MENPVHHVSVVGEEEQPLTVVVQTADGEKTDRIVRKLVHDGGAAFGIGNCRDLADGLVIGDIVLFFLRTDDFTVHGDRIPGFVHLNLSGLFGIVYGQRITGDRCERGGCGYTPARRISFPPWSVRNR